MVFFERLKGWCSRERISYFLVLVIGICLIAVAVIPFPLLTIANNRSENEKNKKEHDFLMYCISELSNVINPISMELFGLAGFLYGHSLKSPPYNGTVAERTEKQYFDAFDFVAEAFLSETNTSEILFVAPGAVITQTYPNEPILLYEDFMHSKIQYSLVFSPLREPSVKEIQSHIDFDERFKTWIILQAMMIFNGSSNNSPFWGMAGVFTDLIKLIQRTNIAIKAAEKQLDFLIAAVSSSTNRLVPIHSSQGYNANSSAGELIDFLLRSESAAFTYNGNTLFNVFIREFQTERTHVSPWVIIAISLVFIIIASSLIFSFVLVPPKQFNRYHNAPRSPPFAVFIIGPQQDKELWSLTLDQLSDSLEKAERKYHAYQIPQAQPYTSYTYALPTVDDAVDMAFNVMKDIHQQSIDSDIVTLLGEDARFIFSCAIHWCTEAEVSLNAREEFVMYGGRDIEYTKDIYRQAVGNAVTLSAKAQEHLSRVSPSDTHVISLSFKNQGGPIERAYYVVDSRSDVICSAFKYAQRISSSSGVNLSALPVSPSVNAEASRPTNNVCRIRSSGGQNKFSIREGTEDHNDENDNEDMPRMDRNFQRYLRSRLPQHELKSKEVYKGNPYLKIFSPSLRKEQRSDSVPYQEHATINFGTSLTKTELDCSDHAAIFALQREPFLGSATPVNNPLMISKSVSSSAAFPTQLLSLPASFSPDGAGQSYPPFELPATSEINARSGSISIGAPSLFLDSSDVPAWLDRALKRIYDRHSLYLRPFPWPAIRFIIYYFYFGYALLFQPLAPRERENIAQCLATAFGVPQIGLYEHLAVRCAMDFISSNENLNQEFFSENTRA